MRQILDEVSRKEGRTTSRLPHFTPYETQMLMEWVAKTHGYAATRLDFEPCSTT
ncbi:hypothetical protein OESDEN_13061 [Oesophagostomum dentatum]|uniref:Uncharacterized protein n=1 Tax=Oesophagostomum dentatum TaxID=61180 RepID=A0A0B1SQH0_OESDE|nr:hypothetical protein OESDEN_13061 [Oesophagostomum dentatum]